MFSLCICTATVLTVGLFHILDAWRDWGLDEELWVFQPNFESEAQPHEVNFPPSVETTLGPASDEQAIRPFPLLLEQTWEAQEALALSLIVPKGAKFFYDYLSNEVEVVTLEELKVELEDCRRAQSEAYSQLAAMLEENMAILP